MAPARALPRARAKTLRLFIRRRSVQARRRRHITSPRWRHPSRTTHCRRRARARTSLRCAQRRGGRAMMRRRKPRCAPSMRRRPRVRCRRRARAPRGRTPQRRARPPRHCVQRHSAGTPRRRSRYAEPPRRCSPREWRPRRVKKRRKGTPPCSQRRGARTQSPFPPRQWTRARRLGPWQMLRYVLLDQRGRASCRTKAASCRLSPRLWVKAPHCRSVMSPVVLLRRALRAPELLLLSLIRVDLGYTTVVAINQAMMTILTPGTTSAILATRESTALAVSIVFALPAPRVEPTHGQARARAILATRESTALAVLIIALPAAQAGTSPYQARLLAWHVAQVDTMRPRGPP
jgi:hypothetical protein